MTLPRDGLLVISKEAGFTSFDVVAKCRRILETKKVGHTGTLDPEATGVLPVVFGRGTKLCELLMEHDKQYMVVIRLGVETDTYDMTGRILDRRPVSITAEEVREAALSFLGEQMQVPPMYSALRVGGKRLYELAREGEVVERKARRVCFSSIVVEKIDLPLVTLLVDCSKGTYIRSLCHDLGEKLGCGGAMESLLRTRSGNFSLEEAHTLSEVERAKEEGSLSSMILSLDGLLRDYPVLTVPPEQEKLLRNGNPLPSAPYGEVPSGFIRMHLPSGELIGLYELRGEELYSVKMLGI